MWVLVSVSGLGGTGGVRVSVYSGLGSGGGGDTKAVLYALAGASGADILRFSGMRSESSCRVEKEELRNNRYTPVSARHGGLLIASS